MEDRLDFAWAPKVRRLAPALGIRFAAVSDSMQPSRRVIGAEPLLFDTPDQRLLWLAKERKGP